MAAWPPPPSLQQRHLGGPAAPTAPTVSGYAQVSEKPLDLCPAADIPGGFRAVLRESWACRQRNPRLRRECCAGHDAPGVGPVQRRLL